MKLTECTLCQAPVRTLMVEKDDDPGTHQTWLVDPTPSLHGWVVVTDLPTGQARTTERGPGRYRPHYETCKGREA